MRLSNIQSTQLGDKQPTIKKTVGILKGAAIHSLEKDRLVFNEYKTIYIKALNNIEKITYVKKLTELLHIFTRGYVDIKNN